MGANLHLAQHHENQDRALRPHKRDAPRFPQRLSRAADLPHKLRKTFHRLARKSWIWLQGWQDRALRPHKRDAPRFPQRLSRAADLPHKLRKTFHRLARKSWIWLQGWQD